MKKKTFREMQTLRGCAGCKYGSDTARPPASHTRAHRQDRLQYTSPQLASAQCKHCTNVTVAVNGKNVFDGCTALSYK